jgi:protein-S-isoprenylcysteine O-methyltransferase Ste14
VVLQAAKIFPGYYLAVLWNIALAELLVCWMLWCLVFVAHHKRHAAETPVVTAPAAKRGMWLQMLGYALVWTYTGPIETRKPAALLMASMILGPASTLLAWSALRHLGKQWRVQAALSKDHELVETGPYRWIRHPIYASMLGMLLATGFVVARWPMLVAALAAYFIGTEIRVRAEDRLLEGRFQEAFTAYRSRVRAYLPFVR